MKILTFSKPTISAAIAGATVVAILWALVAFLTPSVPTLRGNLKVRFTIQTSPSSSTGSTVEGITAIEFHPSYIVIKDKRGNGQAFLPHNTQELTWSR